MKKILIEGRLLSTYRIVYNGENRAAGFVAKKLQEWIASTCGVKPDTVTEGVREDLCGCIVLGAYGAHSLEATAYGDCEMYVKDGAVFVDADDIVGLTEGAAYLAALLTLTTDAAVTGEMLKYSTKLQPREEYLADAGAFLPAYRLMHHVPKEELTLDYKKRKFNDPNGRSFIIAHRCEHIFYPENSLESAISAWRCGADSIELDIQKSSDGVWFCMHDGSLTRTTNATDYVGKDGFPDTLQAVEWSYSQLRALRLKDRFGKLTPFPIPSLEEVLKACDGRMYIHLDKSFSYVNDIFPLMEKVGVYEPVYLVNNIGFGGILQLKDRYAEKGVRLQNMVRTWSAEATAEVAEKLLAQGDHITPAVIPLGDFVKFGDEDFAVIDRYAGRLRIGAWFLRDFDYEELWRQGRRHGINIIMTDHPMDVIALGI